MQGQQLVHRNGAISIERERRVAALGRIWMSVPRMLRPLLGGDDWYLETSGGARVQFLSPTCEAVLFLRRAHVLALEGAIERVIVAGHVEAGRVLH